MTYPLAAFNQKLHRAGRDCPFHWKGNTLTGIEPTDGLWSLFRKIPFSTPPFHARIRPGVGVRGGIAHD